MKKSFFFCPLIFVLLLAMLSHTAFAEDIVTKYVGIGSDADDAVVLSLKAFIDTDGEVQWSDGYRCSGFMPLDEQSTIELTAFGLTSIATVAFYDADRSFLSCVAAEKDWDLLEGEQEIPDGAAYCRITILDADPTGWISCASSIPYTGEDAAPAAGDEGAEAPADEAPAAEAPADEAPAAEEPAAPPAEAPEDAAAGQESADQPSSEAPAVQPPAETEAAKKDEDGSKVMISDIKGQGGYVDSEGKFNVSASWLASDYIPVKAVRSMKVCVQAFSTVPPAVYFDRCRVFIDSEMPYDGYGTLTLSIPEEAYYVRLNLYKSDDSQYYIAETDPAKVAALEIQEATDPLYGKMLGVVGDSVSIGTHSVPGMTYVDQIAYAHNMKLDNQAVWGAAFAVGRVEGGTPRSSIYEQMSRVSPNCDMLIISGGINDAEYFGKDSYWGLISDGYGAVLDTKTFCGAFEATLKAALDKFKGKPILFVIEHRVTQSFRNAYGQHFEEVELPLMIEMLEKWGIPYVDLFHNTPSMKFTPGYIELYSFDDDGVHPNTEGYRRFYVPLVESRLEDLAR